MTKYFEPKYNCRYKVDLNEAVLTTIDYLNALSVMPPVQIVKITRLSVEETDKLDW